MSQAATHALYIWASYGVVALVVGALIAWVVADGRRVKRELERLEAQGVRRRSGQAATAGTAARHEP